MGMLALLVLLLLADRVRKPVPSTPAATQAEDAAARARAAAAAAAAAAAQTGHPADIHNAATAAQTAKILTAHANTQQAAARRAPPPWPQATPSGLPPWPAGWQPDNPPPSAVVTRSWQLLPTLWARGQGARQTENTAGRWITYVAAPMGGGKRGVVAYRVREGFSVTRPQPRNNA